MSTTEAAIWTAVIVVLLLVVLAVALCRAAGRASRMEEERAPGEDAFIGDLETRMKAYAATVADFYDTTTGDHR